MIFPGARLAPKSLAGMGVLAIALALAAQGCLVPQSVDPVSTRPHTIPRVDLTALPDYLLQPVLVLDPQGPSDVTATPPCHCRLEVNIPAIIADDPTVDVEVRVFVDYQLSAPRSPVFRVPLPGSFQSTETTRALGALLPPLDALNLGGTGHHVVELLVAEREGFAPDEAAPQYRAMREGFEASTFKFVVEVKDLGQQTCDVGAQSPPVVRVCQ
jgi:hypothetical protein